MKRRVVPAALDTCRWMWRWHLGSPRLTNGPADAFVVKCSPVVVVSFALPNGFHSFVPGVLVSLLGVAITSSTWAVDAACMGCCGTDPLLFLSLAGCQEGRYLPAGSRDKCRGKPGGANVVSLS
eukprot:5936633-Pyramimonas_sp.AAC.1